MKTVTCQASGLRQSPRTGGAGATGGAAEARRGGPATHGTQSAIAHAEPIAHSPRAGRQPSPVACSIGTITAADTAAPPEVSVEYAPVIAPVRCGKSRLTTTGISVLPTAIAIPASTLPASSVASVGTSRT